MFHLLNACTVIQTWSYWRGNAWAWQYISQWCQSQEGTFFATWHFGNVVWRVMSECLRLQVNSQLVVRQCCSAIWDFPLGRNRSQRGCRALGCSCCLRWKHRLELCVCVAAADAWNGTQVAGRASGLHCIFCQVITLLHWFFSLLHWSEKITGKRERERESERKREMDRGREEPLIDLVLRFNNWQQSLEWQCPLIYGWDPQYIEGVLFYKSLQTQASSFPSQTCWGLWNTALSHWMHH